MSRTWFNVALFAAGGLVGAAGMAARQYIQRRRDALRHFADSVPQVLDAHSDYLLVKHPNYHDKFQKMRTDDLEAATGEAVVFSLLKTYFRGEPEPHDEPGTGGVDFICRRGKSDQFVVEVTSLSPDAVAKQSKIPVTVDEGGGPFSMVTRQLFNTVRDKARQLANYDCPRVLAITSTHFASAALLDAQGAEFLLTSEPTIRFPVPGSQGPIQLTTVRGSAFFGPDADGNIVPRRQSVSAVLLIGIFGDQANVVGLLHPAPARPLDIDRLREVPFVRLRDWPIVDRTVRTEWVTSSPSAKGFYHSAVKLSNRDLLKTS